MGTITKVAHFCSMYGPKFCSMYGPKFCSIKITQEVREYAANQKILIVPTLRVVTPWLTLCVEWGAERPGQHSHAERGNDHQTQ
ncbi:hypothetical protein N5D61_09520 [Pseudomonas sp. GD03842]|uniref:hypothetical protein n=1 Tax=Pseudomonas sp. GD03842 TaxID=2975385 RepID=UPI0024493E0A|nr:hypothetical protein [Pseudomonas sp. GD03842]MDH0746584.1 hypothetical protein [Pseudomonas sp. GD03842]